ncbi:TnpV protein [Butyrivibrio sp. XB500-5]|uniref:TnpV protein n=1 Tax=Butyrivibrio sp. XB500-5 TaxID=2364880 RepID=UPI000EA8D218|nr:TnpV protein [Butyrivibrio sp. XB500-5]RKM61543.1 TnpV protein [Butyrivibrio sp. XB500-5]
MMELEYIKAGDYYIPNLIANQEPQVHLSKYGSLHKAFLKNHRSGVYTGLLLNGELMAHCYEVQERALDMMDRLTDQLAKSEGVTEQLKVSDQMGWVRRMNNIRSRAEEIVLREVVYQL